MVCLPVSSPYAYMAYCSVGLGVFFVSCFMSVCVFYFLIPVFFSSCFMSVCVLPIDMLFGLHAYFMGLLACMSVLDI